MCILRSDPSCAHGSAPGALLLGRPLVYPVEMKGVKIDLSGTEFTARNVSALNQIHDKLFGEHGEKIKKYQQAYKTRLERSKNPTAIQLKAGDKVQLFKKTKSALTLKWTPYNSYYIIESINLSRMTAKLYNPKKKMLFKKSKPLIRLRAYRGRK